MPRIEYRVDESHPMFALLQGDPHAGGSAPGSVVDATVIEIRRKGVILTTPFLDKDISMFQWVHGYYLPSIRLGDVIPTVMFESYDKDQEPMRMAYIDELPIGRNYQVRLTNPKGNIEPFGIKCRVGLHKGLIPRSKLSIDGMPTVYDMQELISEIGDRFDAVLIELVVRPKGKDSLVLSRRQIVANPWDAIDDHVKEDQVVAGRIVGVEEGAFRIRITEGITGLLPQAGEIAPDYSPPREKIAVRIQQIMPAEQNILLALA